jgi:hypothetical protein
MRESSSGGVLTRAIERSIGVGMTSTICRGGRRIPVWHIQCLRRLSPAMNWGVEYSRLGTLQSMWHGAADRA